MFFLSLCKNTLKKLKQINEKSKLTKISKQQIKKNTKIVELVLWWQLPSSVGLSLKCDWYLYYHYVEEDWFSLFQKVLIENSLLGRSGTLCLLILFHTQILSDLNMCRSSLCCPSLCEFILCLNPVAYGRYYFLGVIYHLRLL